MPVEFTVGIPTHNRRETVLLALASALEQTLAPARVCVVADGCTDGTQQAVRDLGDKRVEVIDRPKGFGCGYVHRNEVLKRAGDGVVAWLGDDDLWLPDHLERAGELFDAGVADIVNSMACIVREDGTLVPFGVHWRAPSYRDTFLSTQNRTPSSAVSHFARSALAVGGWPADLERAGDWDLWKRMVRGGMNSEMVVTPTVLFFSAWEREQSWRERVAQNTSFLARLRDPAQLARLRAEMAFVCSAAAHADTTALIQAHQRAGQREREVAAISAERERQLAAVSAERDRLSKELRALLTSAWWRMRRPFEPVLRIRRQLRRRA